MIMCAFVLFLLTTRGKKFNFHLIGGLHLFTNFV